jgi:hypothetical protein
MMKFEPCSAAIGARCHSTPCAHGFSVTSLPRACGIAALDAAKARWGGELPEFDSVDAINELLRNLVMGLWNGLARHQERSKPFRLGRVEIAETRKGLAHIARIRRQELDGFVEGLYGNAQTLEVPQRAHRALYALSELRAIFDGLHELAGNPTKPITPDATSHRPAATSGS